MLENQLEEWFEEGAVKIWWMVGWGRGYSATKDHHQLGNQPKIFNLLQHIALVFDQSDQAPDVYPHHILRVSLSYEMQIL